MGDSMLSNIHKAIHNNITNGMNYVYKNIILKMKYR